ncbi:MAG: folylpolyglutamate synthase/dihydrofolate synthase family protein [Anaerolineaceae bacterium]
MESNDIKLNYQAALDYLYSFVDYSLTRAFRYTADKFNLDRMVLLLESIGNPQKGYKVIHIAGTKGKGSTAAFCAEALSTAGFKVGLYTSPHLEDYCERIQVNGEPISHEEMTHLVSYIKPFVAGIPHLTTFEITTAIGFLYFSRKSADVVVAEVGLGGRLDATNVITPVVSVITSISHDHTNVLGHTLKDIAGEKCGIIKPGVPVVCSPQKEEALAVIQDTATNRESPLTLVGRDVHFVQVQHSIDGQTFYIWNAEDQEKMDQFIESGKDSDWMPDLYEIHLLGFHQLENATTAFATLSVCSRSGLKVSKKAIKDGFKTVQWPARFEILNRRPLLIVDAAHNRDSATRLRLALDDYIPDKKIELIFGASEDKDIEGILTEILPRVERVYATKSEHPRAIDPDILVKLVHQMGKPAIAFNKVEDALEAILKKTTKDTAIVATGSIFIAAAVRTTWLKRSKEHKK